MLRVLRLQCLKIPNSNLPWTVVVTVKREMINNCGITVEN